LAQGRIPSLPAIVREAGEMQIARVDERRLRAEPAEPHRDVAAGLHELRNPRVILRSLVFPPQYFWSVIEARRITCDAQHSLARLTLHPRNLPAAAGVQPRVVRCRRSTIRAYANDSRHLSSHGQRHD